MTPVSVAPSPKSHAYDTTVPSSVDALPSTATASGDGVAVNDATGSPFTGTSGTITDWVVVAAAPSSSATVSDTVYVPAAA